MAMYAILLYAPEREDTAEPVPEERQAHDRHADDLTKSGAMVAAFALQPTATATSLRGDAITDGPFLEGKEIVAGFYVIDVPDLDAALEVARRNPILRQGGGLEVRPVEGGSVQVRSVDG